MAAHLAVVNPLAAHARGQGVAPDPRDAGTTALDTRPFVEVRGVSKTFETRDGSVRALETVDAEIYEHEFVSLVGPSGCGKSTLMMIISGLTKPSTGSIHINGREVTRPYTDLGFVFQRDVLLDWRTVLGNVMFQADVRKLDRKSTKERAMALLESVGLDQFANRMPHELSGGMRQRTSICRALVHEPPLLLMDEPFGALDALTRDQLNIDLQRIYQEKRMTVVFVTHSIPEAIFLSDRVFVISPRPGRVEEIIDIDLPRPRKLDVRETPEFAAYVRHVRRIFQASGLLLEE